MNNLVLQNHPVKKIPVNKPSDLSVRSRSHSNTIAKIKKPLEVSSLNSNSKDNHKDKPITRLHRISLDGLNLTVPIPNSEIEKVNSKLDQYKTKSIKSGGLAENKQYKSNCFRENGQYKDYVVIEIKTNVVNTCVYIGYRPIGNQNPLWIRFNPAHFTPVAYKQLKTKLAKILGMKLLLKSIAKAIPTRLDIAVDITGITPDYLLTDLREARDSALHLKGGRVSSMTMGTNRSTTSAIVYNKALTVVKGNNPEHGTRIEIRLRRMNSANKPVTFATLADCLPANPFNRLDIYQVEETEEDSTIIKLVVAAARACGLKGVLQMLNDQERRKIRKQLTNSKVEYFDADQVWDEVLDLLEPLSVLYTED